MTREVSSQVWDDYMALREKYKHFSTYIQHVFEDIYKIVPDDIQLQIAHDMQYTDNKYTIYLAQRGGAKSTIGGGYSDWSFIQAPEENAGILSAGEKLAGHIAHAALRILMTDPELYMLRPNNAMGDRSSTTSWDINHAFKGINKQPSMVALGINANLQGNRLDLVLGDDLEQQKNAKTPVTRADLLNAVRELANIASQGRIMLLGTYQNLDSIYFALEKDGFKVIVYPGRFPVPANIAHYRGNLSPWVIEHDPGTYHWGDGSEGAPTSPRANKDKKIVLDPEDPDYHQKLLIQADMALIQRRPIIGELNYSLNVMLDPKLQENALAPMHPKNLMVVDPNEAGEFPAVAIWSPVATPGFTSKLNPLWVIPKPAFIGEYVKPRASLIYIDPAGGGIVSKNEIAYSECCLVGNLYVIKDIAGFPGGYSNEILDQVAFKILATDLSEAYVESNFGEGMWTNLLQQKLDTLMMSHHTRKIVLHNVKVSSTVSKLKRISKTMSPLVGTHSLAITTQALLNDEASVLNKPFVKEGETIVYSLLQQCESFTESGGLLQDDRIDSTAGNFSKLLELYPAVPSNSDTPEESDEETQIRTVLNYMGLTNVKTLAKRKLKNWGIIQ